MANSLRFCLALFERVLVLKLGTHVGNFDRGSDVNCVSYFHAVRNDLLVELKADDEIVRMENRSIG